MVPAPSPLQPVDVLSLRPAAMKRSYSGVPYNGNGKTMENILENHWAGENHWGGFKENPLETHWVHDLSHAFAVECRPHAKKTQNCSSGVCTREYCPPHIYFKPLGQT